MRLKTLGEKLADMRHKRGLSQRALSEACGISPRTLQYWESNAQLPSGRLGSKLASYYGLTLGGLLSGIYGGCVK